MRILIPNLLTASLLACTGDKKDPHSTTITFYGDYGLNFLTTGLKPLSELPPNASLINFGGFVSDGPLKSPVKFNLILIGQFDLPQTTASNDLSGISGKITSISHSVNDQVLMSISNLNLDAKSFVTHINAQDANAAWADIVSSAGAITITAQTPAATKLYCTLSQPSLGGTQSVTLEQPATDVKGFIAQCLNH